MKHPFPRSLALLALLASPSWSQWDVLPGPHTSYSTADGSSVVAVETFDGLHAFSAATKRWEHLGPPGTTLVSVGDWVVVYETVTGELVAYSARLNESTTMPGGPPPPGYVASAVGDVVFEFEDDGSGGGDVRVYSAQTGTWSELLGLSFVLPVVTDTAIGIQDVDDLHGFSARTGTVSSITVSNPGARAGDGNVLLWEHDLGPDTAVSAFSGVLGIWAPPIVSADPGAGLQLDHNVAFLSTPVDPYVQEACYSAYTGEWLVDTDPSFAAALVSISDNVVFYAEVTPNLVLLAKAFGARSTTFESVPGTSTVAHEADYLMTRDSSTLYAFSGLIDGPFVSESMAGFGSSSAGRSCGAVLDSADELHGYSAMRGVWATASLPGPALLAGDSVILAETSTAREAFSARRGVWETGPIKLLGSTYETTVAGSVIAQHSSTTGNIFVYDDLRPGWSSAYMTPGFTPDLEGAGNLFLADTEDPPGTSGPFWAYSAQRGTWDIVPLGFTPGTILDIYVRENVVLLRDDSLQLWAYGSPSDTLSWYEHPNGTEYQSASTASAPVHARSTIRANPGDVAVWMWALAPDFTGLFVPGVTGLMYLDVSFLLFSDFEIVPPSGLALVEAPMPFAPPAPLQIWTQGAIVDGLTGAVRVTQHAAEPFSIY